MAGVIEPIARIANEMSKLPGVGRKTALRLAYYIASMPEDRVREMAVALYNGRKQVKYCSLCGDFATSDPCPFCSDPERENGMLCVVHDPRDVVAVERMRDYKGRYHVLHGAISPMTGVGPNDLRIKELLERVETGTFEEVILATNPTVEGEATAAYITRLLRPTGVRITRLAQGVPVGGELEYADEMTLSRAFEGRMGV